MIKRIAFRTTKPFLTYTNLLPIYVIEFYEKETCFHTSFPLQMLSAVLTANLAARRVLQKQ